MIISIMIIISSSSYMMTNSITSDMIAVSIIQTFARAGACGGAPEHLLRLDHFAGLGPDLGGRARHAANLRTKILEFGGFASSRIFILRGGILMSIGKSQDWLSQQILVGIIFVGRLGEPRSQGAATVGSA